MREGRAGKDGERRLRARLVRDFVHQQAGAGLDALGAEHQAPRPTRGRPPRTARRCWAGVDDEQRLAVGKIGEIGDGADRGRQRARPGRNSSFSWPRVDRIRRLPARAPRAAPPRRPPRATWASAVPQAPPPITPTFMRNANSCSIRAEPVEALSFSSATAKEDSPSTSSGRTGEAGFMPSPPRRARARRRDRAASGRGPARRADR